MNNDIRNVHEDYEPPKKEFIDPASITAQSIFAFVIIESLRAIVGFLTLRWFPRLWKKWTSNEPNDNPKIPKKK